MFDKYQITKIEQVSDEHTLFQGSEPLKVENSEIYFLMILLMIKGGKCKVLYNDGTIKDSSVEWVNDLQRIN